MSEVKQEPAPSTTPSPSNAGGDGGGTRKGAALRDEARRTPGLGAQAKLYATERHGAPTKGPATKKKEEAKGLDDAALFAAYEKTRKAGFAPGYIAKVEAGLGLPSTMSPSPELAKGIADREMSAGRKATGLLEKGQRDWLGQEIPELAKEEPFPVVGDAGTTAKKKGGGTDVPENEAVQNAGLAKSYTAYLATMSDETFLEQPVTGHREFLARLSGAEAYLTAKLGKAPAEIAKEWGITKVVGLRVSDSKMDQLHHGTGFAMDVNPPQNDWNFGNPKHAETMREVMANVELLFGAAMVKSSGALAKAASGKTTEETYDTVEASNEGLRRYRSFAADPAALDGYLASPDCPAKAQKLGAVEWRKRLAKDETRIAKRAEANVTDTGPAGFMDQKKELVVALRDVGGLRWGATDFGAGESGDIMHFDGHYMSTAARIREEKNKVKAAADQKKAEPG